jgi:hypothetical protein
MRHNISGVRTDCITGEEQEVELEYEITLKDGYEVFQLFGGPTGYESFTLKPLDIPGLEKWNTDKDEIMSRNWVACAGTKGTWDKLVIPASEMAKIVWEVE